MSKFKIGCGQITWVAINWQRPEAEHITAEEMLADIAQAGYEGAPAGPEPNQSHEDTLAPYKKYGLKPAPGYLSADFWDAAKEAEIMAMAHTFGQFHQTAGIEELYVAATVPGTYQTKRGLTRWQIAGHVQPEDGMSDKQYRQFAKALNQLSEITLSYGVKSCFHNHVGSVIETSEEIDHLFSLVNREVVFMGPDTGHLKWGGADVLEVCRKYVDSIKTIHIKDVNEAVLQEGVAGKWGYGQFAKAGIWTELGQGCIDFPALFTLLDEADFNGWVIVETDETQLTPLESAIASREYLKKILG